MKGVSESAIEKLKAYDFHVYHSLIRSTIRKYVLLYFLEHPEKATISDIADCIHASYSNTWGAIVGDGRKYRKEESLLVMRLIARERFQNNHYFYSLTSKGNEVAKLLEEADLDRNVQPDEEIRSKSCRQ